MSLYDKLSDDIKAAIGSFAAEYGYLVELRNNLDKISSDLTIPQEEKAYENAQKILKHIRRTERNSERPIKEVIEIIANGIGRDKILAEFHKRLELSTENLLKAFSMYTGEFKQQMAKIDSAHMLKEHYQKQGRDLEVKKAEQAVILLVSQAEENINTLIHWLRGIETDLKAMDSNPVWLKKISAMIAALSISVGSAFAQAGWMQQDKFEFRNEQGQSVVVNTRFKTIGFETLEIEAKAKPFKTDIAFEKLDDFLLAANSALKPYADKIRAEHRDYTRQEAIEILGKIQGMFEIRGYKYEITDLLSDALISGKIDCDILSLLFVSIGQIAHLPISAVEGPGHMFIRWSFKDGSSFDWEATAGKSADDELSFTQPAPESIATGAYMRPLSLEDLEGYAYALVAHSAKIDNKLGLAADLARESMRLFPKGSLAPSILGSIAFLNGNYKQAIDYCNIALALDPYRVDALTTKANAYEQLGQLEDALKAYNRALRASIVYQMQVRIDYLKTKIKDIKQQISLQKEQKAVPRKILYSGLETQ